MMFGAPGESIPDRLLGRTLVGRLVLELFRVIWLVPEGFHEQTDQSIRRSIRKKSPIDTNGEMKIKASKHNWAS